MDDENFDAGFFRNQDIPTPLNNFRANPSPLEPKESKRSRYNPLHPRTMALSDRYAGERITGSSILCQMTKVLCVMITPSLSPLLFHSALSHLAFFDGHARLSRSGDC